MKTTPPPTKKDYALAELARTRLEQTGVPPSLDELKSIDRIIVEQARARLLEQQAAAATRLPIF
jgi:hypothetical protein